MLPTTLGPFLSLLLLAGLQSIWSSTPQEPKATGTPQSEISILHHPTWTLGLQLYRSLRTDTSQTNTLISPLLLGSDLCVKVMEPASCCTVLLHCFPKKPLNWRNVFWMTLSPSLDCSNVALDVGEKQDDTEKLHSWAKGGMGGEETPAGTLNQELTMKAGAMILANALHFKENQDLLNFLGTKYTKVPMMHRSASLGLEDVWNETSGKLHLGDVLQWTSLELDHVSGSKDDVHEDEHVKPKLFNADHSFIILVRDNISGALVMIGALDQNEGPSIHDEL
ncbi:hypothetical protein IRJ41_005416 [Triplophysa rosa]|uniref:Serpin domain-containing protein n=1 Tax=Triplophysa rosa TaxID=992332 RepID=A0A9W7X5E3_TRIRA|nr:hypothetical protein IRJ41_005416 [Triplophysa rosa]